MCRYLLYKHVHVYVCMHTDINECELIPDLCAKNATCTNDVGSYQCSCNTGFTGDGTTCSEYNNSSRDVTL